MLSRCSLRLGPLLILLGLFFFPLKGQTASPPPFSNWQTLETEHFRINYQQPHTEQALRLANIAESAYPKITGYLDWQPKRKTQVNLFDFTDDTHGWANVIPYPLTGIFMTPPDEGELLGNDDWLQLVFTHEFLHIVHLDKVRATPASLHNVFGRHPWLFPNRFQPTWVTEGLATYTESHFSLVGGGRTQSPYYEMMMRLELAEGLKSIGEINSNGSFWPLNHSYLYGSYFFLFLKEEYGDKIISQYVNDYSDNLVPYRIVSNPLKSTGMKLPQLWQSFEQWLHRRFDPQIAQIREQGEVSGNALTKGGFFSGSPAQNNLGELYFVENDANSHAYLAQLIDEEQQKESSKPYRRLTKLQPSARIDSHPSKGIIIAQQEICDHNRNYYDLFLLPRNENKPRRLTRCSRYRLASWHPNGKQLAAVHVNQGIVRIDLLSSEGLPIETLYRGGTGEAINSIDWSVNGQQLLVSRKINQQWDLYNLDAKTHQWQQITDDKVVQLNGRYSDDGKHIVYSSDRGGHFRIRKLNIDSSTVSTLSNQLGASLQPSGYGKDGVLAYVAMGSGGQDIYQLGLKQSKIGTYTLPSLAQTSSQTRTPVAPLKTSNYQSSRYNPLRSMAPTSWEPAWRTDDGDSTAVGFSVSGQDAVGLHYYNMQFLYETDVKEYFGTINYVFDQRLFLSADKEFDVEVVVDGKTSIYETNTEYQMAYTFPFDTLDERWHISPAYSFERVKYKSRDGSLQAARENILGINFLYSNVQQYLLSHGPAEGRSIEFIAEGYDWLNNDFTGEVYTVDWHEYLPAFGTTFALRYMQGWGTENPTPFELGGVFSEYEFDIPRINQRSYSLRGYSENTTHLRGRRARFASAEWRIPVNHEYYSYMVPPAGFGKVSTILFGESGSAWDEGGSPDNYYSSAGAEIIAEIILGYNLVLDTRFGYAHGFDEIGEDRYYVRIGRAF